MIRLFIISIVVVFIVFTIAFRSELTVKDVIILLLYALVDIAIVTAILSIV